MQQVAREMNLSETAFLCQRPDGFDLRWFTPAIAVPLCGHATLASAHVLWEDGHLPIPVFGHAGDGNLHPNILFDARDPTEMACAWQAAEAIFVAARELGGALSGEHGIGTLKRPCMTAALSGETLALQRAAAFDPEGWLNPGKVLPEDNGHSS